LQNETNANVFVEAIDRPFQIEMMDSASTPGLRVMDTFRIVGNGANTASVVVSNIALVVTNQNQTGTLNIEGDGSLRMGGGRLEADRINATNNPFMPNGGFLLDNGDVAIGRHLSVVTSNQDFRVGYNANGNRVFVGPNSWLDLIGLDCGSYAGDCLVHIEANASVTAPKVTVGDNAPISGTPNLVDVRGALIATNAGGAGVIDIRTGTLAISNGMVLVDNLLMTNNSVITFTFPSGLLRASSTPALSWPSKRSRRAHVTSAGICLVKQARWVIRGDAPGHTKGRSAYGGKTE